MECPSFDHPPVQWDDKACVNVHVSSVLPNGTAGWGVYAGRQYEVGDLVPIKYPGLQLTPERYNELNDHLIGLTDKPAVTKDDMKYLSANFGFWIVDKNDDSNVDIGSVYDTFIRYTIQAHWSGLYYCPDSYYANGTVHVDGCEDDDCAFFINEPPQDGTAKFTNIVRGRPQKARANVMTVSAEDGRITFVAMWRIPPGGELLYDYGPFYNRSHYSSSLESPACSGEGPRRRKRRRRRT